MTQQRPHQNSATSPRSTQREDRRAKALRENLRKRKLQQQIQTGKDADQQPYKD